MAVYIDRNIFYTKDESYENDEFQDISHEKIDYAYNRHVDNYFKDYDDDEADQVCSDGRFFVTDKDFCKGSQEWSNGDLFYGDFLNGKRNAWGCYQWDNGEGFFSEDQRYGPGVLITSRTTISAPVEIDVGYWKNDRLIRLRKSVLSKKQSGKFQFSEQFPQYNFYKLVNLELMFKNFQYQKSVKRDYPLLNSEHVYNYDEKLIRETNESILNSYDKNSSKDLLIEIIQNILKHSNLPTKFQVWNMKSPLFEKFIADQSFEHLIRCLPTFIDSSIVKFNGLKNILQILKSTNSQQNDNLNSSENEDLLYSMNKKRCDQEKDSKRNKNLKNNLIINPLFDTIKQTHYENNFKQDSLFDSQFQQNQTVCLVNMRAQITKTAHLQEFLRSTIVNLPWHHLTSSSTDETDHIISNKVNNIQGTSEHNSSLVNTFYIENWSTIWNKLSKKSLMKKSNTHHKLKTKHESSTQPLSTGRYETLAIQFIQYCFNGQFDKVKNLLQIENQVNKSQFCVDPNVADSQGQFGLLGAVLTWNMKLVNLLLDFGANINQLTDDGLTVFTICLLKYYELFDEIIQLDKTTTTTNNKETQSEQSSQHTSQSDSRRQHILFIITKTLQDDNEQHDTDSKDDGDADDIGDDDDDADDPDDDKAKKLKMQKHKQTNSETEVQNSKASPIGRNYVYRVELPILLSTTSSESMISLRRAARLSQIRRMHLTKIRLSRRSLMIKSSETRKSMQITSNIDPPVQAKNDSISLSETTTLPSFQRFTNCLTRFHTEIDNRLKSATQLDLKPVNYSHLSKINTYTSDRKSRPQTMSLDRRNKQTLIDVASKDVLINKNYRITSPVLRRSAAYELSKNPYFLASHTTCIDSNIDDNTASKLEEGNVGGEEMKKASSDEQTDGGHTIRESSLDQQAILLAKQKQMMDIIDLLLKRGANPNTGIRPLPALFLAVQAGDPDMVRKLIQHGADTNICLRVDNPLKSDSPISQGICIDEDEAPLTPSLDGLTVLHYAVLVPDEMGVHLTEILLQDGKADPNKQATLDDSFKLKHQYNAGIQSGSSSGMNSERTTPIEKKIHEGRTPLHLVCSREYDQLNSAIIAKCLLNYGADPNLLCNGHSALSIAIATGNDPCINVLINHPNTNINQALECGFGSALCVACSSLFEFRRSVDARLELIKRLINRGGVQCFNRFTLLKPKETLGNVIDFTYMDYAKDLRITKTPYHALNEIEKETYNGRIQILAYLADRLRRYAYSLDTLGDGYDGDGDGDDKAVQQINTGTRENQAKLSFPKRSQQSPTYLRQKSCISYSFCYECGRSAGIRLVLCSRCRRVYFCSKVCKLKSWTTRHKNECYLSPELQAERDRRSPTRVLPKLGGNKQEKDEQIAQQKAKQQYLSDWDLSKHLTCCSSSGELIGIIYHPSYRYRYALNHYLKINDSSHIIVGTYNGEGNYSLI
ncbi:unnamed protein product [Trichobilharzia szidati]|nr:unnamed protein product [Trichobilharzia szidati]